MPKGYSLHIGMNAVHPDHYDGWSGCLLPCENDAEKMKEIADSLGYTSKLLLTNQAEKNKVINEIENISTELFDGDIFLFTFSGHGGRIPNPEWKRDPELSDETICLYDEMLVDDELRYLYWPKFKKGVRIVCVFDSCHSGGMIKAVAQGKWTIEKTIPNDKIKETFKLNKARYLKIQDKIIRNILAEVAASVCIFAACKQSQVALAGVEFSMFTQHLLEIWQSGGFNTLKNLCEKVKYSINNYSSHTPNLEPIKNKVSKSLEHSDPFVI